MNRKSLMLVILILLLSVSAVFLIYKLKSGLHEVPDLRIKLPEIEKPFFQKNAENITKFESQEDFVDYLEKASRKNENLGGFLSGRMMMEEMIPLAASDSAQSMNAMGFSEKGSGTPERVSETNVQVLGIDEPDIVKTDGKKIYFSSEQYPILYSRPVAEDSLGTSREIMPVPPRLEDQAKIKIISAFPVSELQKIGSIDKAGQLLLTQDKKTLVIFSGLEIFGYDVSSAKGPKEKWKIKMADNSNLISSRLSGENVYLAMQNRINRQNPCPLKPLMIGNEEMNIDCADIYHPERIVPADSSFTVMSLNAKNGKVEEKASFIGSTSNSQVYMSANSIYVAYQYLNDPLSYMVKAMNEKAKDLFPEDILKKLAKVAEYDISDEAKFTEFGNILEDYYAALSNDEQLRLRNEFENRLARYTQEHKRDFEKTGIVKIDVPDLSVSASGNVPGQLLNQFSLDEYENNLRVATTIGNSWGWGQSSRESSNDVYVLDKDLEVIGSIQDLGVTERIYSARFLGKRGYLVTFRQTDPFYVLDLSDPKNPQMKEELKIPGFSSYLHPLADDIILGIGQESGKVKLSLFDVKNPADPQEIDKYQLSEYWSEAQNNHHAFLQDAKHNIFFLPGGEGGYVFSYDGNKLVLKKAVSDYLVKRAVYIEDYLYIIGEKKITVFDETKWEKVKELDL